jgi:CRISPR-associated protein Csm2
MVANRRGRVTGEQLARDLARDEDLHTIIATDTAEAVRLLDATARKISEKLYRDITTSQIRNIFGAVRMIEQDTKGLDNSDPLPVPVQRSLMMLRPKLAYQYGRVGGRDDAPNKVAMGAMTTILTNAITIVLDQGSQIAFRNFVDFFEAILAYHRYYGGRTN